MKLLNLDECEYIQTPKRLKFKPPRKFNLTKFIEYI